MKQPISARIIEFPLKLIMVKTCNIFAAFAVIFLTSLSLSSAFINQDFDTPKHFQENLDLELQPFLREKREKDDLVKNDSLELEELSESETIHDRRAIAEETQKLNHKDDEKNEEPETSNDAEEDVKDDMYKNMHDLIQAFILADEQDIAMRLQQLRELENATESEKLSNLPKRSASAAAAAAASSNLLGANLWEPVPLADLDAHSCEAESVEYGHVHLSGLVVHEFFCEIRKLWHYFLIVVRNLKAGLTLGPLIAEGVVEGTHGILSTLFHHTPRLLHTIIREPHHLLVLPDIIHDCVPHDSIFHAFLRLGRVGFKLIHFARGLFYRHINHVFGHFFHLHHLGVHLRERLLGHKLLRLHHLYGGVGQIVPYLEEEVGQFGGPVASAVSAAATASASAAAAATATAAADGGEILVPDYRTSLAEVLSSFRGIYDGYHASGIPHLVRSGVRNIATTSTYTKVVSYLTNLPSCFGNVRSYITRIPSFLNYIRSYTPEQGSTVTATASASSSVSSPVVGPAIIPIASVAPVAPVETVSASASASASVAETPVVSAAPFYSAVPSIIPSSGASAAAAAAAVSAAAAASAASASPIVSNAVPCTPVIESLSPGIVSETIENTVSESSAAASSVAVSSPEVIAPSFAEDNSVATASASASASSASDVSPVISAAPFSLPYSLRYRSRPILSAAGPASVASASSSASVSSGGNVIEPGQYGGLDYNLYNRYPLSRSRLLSAALPAAAPSSAVATAAASAASGGASAASAASSSGGLNFLLPRESIIAALGHDYLTPGDLISITLRNKATLIGRILDASSPVSFSFLRPKLRHSLLRHSGRVWNLSPFDFRDPECVRRLNSPLLLRHAI